MKRIITIQVFLILIASIRITAQNIDLSSVDKFFEISAMISESVEPTEKDWESLFETNGYKISASSSVRKTIIKEMMIVAFNPTSSSKIDSILTISIKENIRNPKLVLSRLTLENYLEIKQNLESLKNFRKTYDFSMLKESSEERLRTFLANPIDSLIVFPSINLLCYELDGQSKNGGIVMDFNLFYKLSEEGKINFMAHEMFHTYRAQLIDKELIKSSSFYAQLDKLHDEGLADLIDKKDDLLKSLSDYGLSNYLVELAKETYDNTPIILKEFEDITLLFVHKEISEEEFNSQLANFFTFGGHPQSYYMTKSIKNAGLENELLSSLNSPTDFIKIYNKAAKIANTYVFSQEFIDFSESLKNNR